MKKLLLVLLLGTMVTADIGSTTIQVNSRNFTSEPTQRRRATLTLKNAGPVVVSPWLIAGDSAAVFTDTNGIGYFSNVLAGEYRLDIAGSPGRSFPISVFDTNGIVSAADLVNSTNINTAFYTVTQIDALLAALPTGTNGSSDPNVLTNNQSTAVTFGNSVSASSFAGGSGNISAISAVTVTASGGISGPGTGLTAVPASAIATGTIDDARLPATITSDITGNAATASTVATLAGNVPQLASIADTNWPAWATNKSDYYRGVMGNADDWIVFIDLGVDMGDETAHCLINYFQDNGEANVLAYFTPMTNTFAAAAIEVNNRAYGRGHIPIGMNKATSAYANSDYFGNYLATNYYNSIGDRANALSDVTLGRRLLATRADRSLTVVVLGQWTSVKRIFDSAADSISPLTGAQLLALKVRRYVVMGGDYPTGSEYNFTTDPTSAAVLNTITNYKTFIGYTPPLFAAIGLTIPTLTTQHPLRGAYTNYQYTSGGTTSRPGWDETAAWYAARGATWKGTTYFTRHSTGYNTVNASTGANAWTDDGIDHNQEYIDFAVSLNTFTNEVNAAITTEPLNGNAAALSIKGGELKSLNLTGTGIFGMTNYLGYLYASNGSSTFPSITFASAPGYGFYPISGVAIGVVVGQVERLRFFSSYIDLKSDEAYRWSSSTLGSSADLMLDRESAGLFRVSDGVSVSNYRDLRARTVIVTNIIYATAPLASWIQPPVGGVSAIASNGYLYSIHNVAGTFTTNLIKAP